MGCTRSSGNGVIDLGRSTASAEEATRSPQSGQLKKPPSSVTSSSSSLRVSIAGTTNKSSSASNGKATLQTVSRPSTKSASTSYEAGCRVRRGSVSVQEVNVNVNDAVEDPCPEVEKSAIGQSGDISNVTSSNLKDEQTPSTQLESLVALIKDQPSALTSR
ncbi:hypothetical protein BDN72DRAFT_590845 [Pluteus cervinus]|uniref:Uncharacterized protein n=1 Tax=Pluteus cervinus TaxID=181527 RepID=A0ACD3A2V0_9AGAR|nr:hypothetical protein BDN72DRAFT_590845 [Pluteus cervinus]